VKKTGPVVYVAGCTMAEEMQEVELLRVRDIGAGRDSGLLMHFSPCFVYLCVGTIPFSLGRSKK